MGYKTVAVMSDDFALRQRLIAAAAQENIDDPVAWVELYRWEIAAQPGWDAAWDSALAADPPNPDPGNDESVITDGMILSGVQQVWNEKNPPDAPGRSEE